MDRIEDETIRYLFFLQVTRGDDGPGGGGGGGARPVLPFSPDGDDEEEDEEESSEEALVGAPSDQRRAAQATVQDFTRNIQRKKEKEMADLQFAGGSSGAIEKKQAISDKKAGRNDPCPCGSGKKYKKCCGS
jgi:preprotein translocase subunit SecA